MQFFRRLVRSKIGGYLALGLLLLIFIAFAAGDITGSGGLGVLQPSTSSVARIGNQTISIADLQSRTQRLFERVRQEKPELTLPQFLAQGGLKQVLDEMIAVKALIAYGEKHGMRVSKKLVDAEIARTPAFADATGAFSESQFRSLLAQQHVSESELREDFAGQIIRQHLLLAAAAGARTPESMVPPYAAMLLEQRSGEAMAVPSQAFAPTNTPTDAELQRFYATHPDDFTLPEQRKLRYLLLSRDRFDAQAAPTDAELAAAYKQRASQYAAREARDVTQLIVPTEAQAKDFAAKVAAGKALTDLAREAGLSPIPLTDQDLGKLTIQTNSTIAKAAFGTPKGKVAGPFKLPLGWTLIGVDAIRSIPGKTLEQAKADLIPELRDAKAKQLFADFVNKIDGKLGEGATMADIAKANGLQIVETPLITAQGRDLRNADYKADEVVTALIKPGFAMAQGDDAQVVQVKPDEQAAVLAPGDVVAAGPPPFAEVKNAVLLDWKLTQGAAKARAAADRLAVLLNKGVAPDEALKQAGIIGQPRQPLNVRRIDISQMQGKAPPPILALLTMKTGSARVVPMEKNLGFLVVRLEKITEQDPSGNAQLIQSTRAGLANVLGQEYAQQLTTAIEKEVKVERNASAIASVEKALRDANGAAQ